MYDKNILLFKKLKLNEIKWITLKWFINKKEWTRFRANNNWGKHQLERTDLGWTDSSEQVDRKNEPDTPPEYLPTEISSTSY